MGETADARQRATTVGDRHGDEYFVGAGRIVHAHLDTVEMAAHVGGVDVMELTLRTEAAIPALGRIRQEVPEMVAGIGTVLTPEQVTAAVKGGATFAVAPGTNERVIRAAQQVQLPWCEISIRRHTAMPPVRHL